MGKDLEKIVKPLLNWYQKEKRDLPWRHTKDPYKIWISEIMLQQTRVETVKEYYLRFIKELPTLEDLAKVDTDKLLKLWEGLGYYTRARNLKKCAETLLENGKKSLPQNYEELKNLPGIGPYAAGSIGSIAYGLKTPAIDGNVLRVMTRIHEDERDISMPLVRKDYFQKLSQIMPENTRDFTESLMELGALICLPNTIPLCKECPLKEECLSYQHQTMMNFPKKKKESPRKIENKTILIYEYHKKYAIQKRAETGLLASMYEFPNQDQTWNKKMLQDYLTKQKINVSKIEELGTYKHIFSHLEWHMIGYLIHLNKPISAELWVTKEELQSKYSLPNAYIKYAKHLKM